MQQLPRRLIIIRDPGIAEILRQHFEAIWSLGKPVPYEIHKFHYEMKTQKILEDVQKERKIPVAIITKASSAKKKH